MCYFQSIEFNLCRLGFNWFTHSFMLRCDFHLGFLPTVCGLFWLGFSEILMRKWKPISISIEIPFDIKRKKNNVAFVWSVLINRVFEMNSAIGARFYHFFIFDNFFFSHKLRSLYRSIQFYPNIANISLIHKLVIMIFVWFSKYSQFCDRARKRMNSSILIMIYVLLHCNAILNKWYCKYDCRLKKTKKKWRTNEQWKKNYEKYVTSNYTVLLIA